MSQQRKMLPPVAVLASLFVLAVAGRASVITIKGAGYSGRVAVGKPSNTALTVRSGDISMLVVGHAASRIAMSHQPRRKVGNAAPIRAWPRGVQGDKPPRWMPAVHSAGFTTARRNSDRADRFRFRSRPFREPIRYGVTGSVRNNFAYGVTGGTRNHFRYGTGNSKPSEIRYGVTGGTRNNFRYGTGIAKHSARYSVTGDFRNHFRYGGPYW